MGRKSGFSGAIRTEGNAWSDPGAIQTGAIQTEGLPRRRWDSGRGGLEGNSLPTTRASSQAFATASVGRTSAFTRSAEQRTHEGLEPRDSWKES